MVTVPDTDVKSGSITSSGPIGARSELRSGEVQVVGFLESMVRELVAGGHAEASRLPLRIDEVDTGDLRLLAAVGRVGRNDERLEWAAEDGADALEEPLGRRADGPAVPGDHPASPDRNIRMLSVSSASPASCIAARSVALPR